MPLRDRINEHILDLNPYQPGKPIEELERELGIRGSIKLASNENPIGPSPRAVAAMREELEGVHRYPDGASFALRAAMAARLDVAEEQLVFGCGADEILELLKIAHRKFYMRPKFIARQVLGLSTTSELKRLTMGALSLAKLELLNAKSRTAPV